MATALSVKTVATTAVIEFQLIENIHHGIVGRLYIPAACFGTGKVRGKKLYDSTYRGNRTIEFKGTVAEYQRCLKEYAGSNMGQNRWRTRQLLKQLFNTSVAEPEMCPNPSLPEIVSEEEVKQAVAAMTQRWEEEEAANAHVEEQADMAANALQPDVILDFPLGDIKAVEVTINDYLEMTVKQLRDLAKHRNIKVPSKAKKLELAEALFNWEPVIDAGYDLLSDEEKLAYCKSIGAIAAQK